jgi:hypothetical protein
LITLKRLEVHEEEGEEEKEAASCRIRVEGIVIRLWLDAD